MSKQPEALRLADWLEDQYDPTHNQAQAAALLRQLHEANEAFGKRQEWWNERMFVLEQQRDALLEALEMHVPQYLKDRGYPPITALKAALAEPPKPVPLKRGTTGRSTRKVCECEKEGLGLECIYLEPVIDGYPLWSGMPKAEPVQEPSMWGSGDGYWVRHDDLHHRPDKYRFTIPLYAAPPQRKPLTEEEIKACEKQAMVNGALLAVVNKLEYSSDGCIKRYPEESEVSAAIERAHDIT